MRSRPGVTPNSRPANSATSAATWCRPSPRSRRFGGDVEPLHHPAARTSPTRGSAFKTSTTFTWASTSSVLGRSSTSARLSSPVRRPCFTSARRRRASVAACAGLLPLLVAQRGNGHSRVLRHVAAGARVNVARVDDRRLRTYPTRRARLSSAPAICVGLGARSQRGSGPAAITLAARRRAARGRRPSPNRLGRSASRPPWAPMPGARIEPLKPREVAPRSRRWWRRPPGRRDRAPRRVGRGGRVDDRLGDRAGRRRSRACWTCGPSGLEVRAST